jgi:hypothetical protein
MGWTTKKTCSDSREGQSFASQKHADSILGHSPAQAGRTRLLFQEVKLTENTYHLHFLSAKLRLRGATPPFPISVAYAYERNLILITQLYTG